MIVRNTLLNFDNAYIFQNDEWFRLSLDSVLLANFVTLRFSDKRILDLCTGNAPIPMLLSYRTRALIVGVELQKCVFDLGSQSVKFNKMDEQIKLINDDVRVIDEIFTDGSFDVITCNPPYFKLDKNSHISDNVVKRIARHEVMLTLEDIFRVSGKLLKNGGIFAMVHRPDRLMEIFEGMRKYSIEPKRIQFVYPKLGSSSNMILVEGTKNGKVGLKVLRPMIVHNDDGSYKKEILNMFSE